MAVIAGPEWASLICGGVIILNLLAYTTIYPHAFFIYAGCAAGLAVILGLAYRLDYFSIYQAALVMTAYVYLLLGSGYYLLKRSAVEVPKAPDESSNYSKVYAYPLVNSALVISVLLIFAIGARGNPFPSAAITALASIFYLLMIKIYPYKRWLYPFQILMTISIVSLAISTVSLTWGLFPGRLLEIPPASIIIVACALTNVWVILGLTVGKWKESICSRLKLPLKDYDAPFFHWTTLMDSAVFLALIVLVSGERTPTGLVCQILVSSSLFLFLYRRFQRYQTALLYVSGLLTVWWASMLTGSYSTIILTTALYAILWYALARFRSRVRKALKKIKLTFSAEERGRLLKTVDILIYCNTGLALLLASSRINSIAGTAAIFMIAAIYLFSAFDRKRKVWGYLGIAVSSLGCYAALSVFLPIETYGWAITMSFGFLALILAYFWEILGVWMRKRREGMGFFSEPCKWMGIAFTAVALIFTFLFVANVSQGGPTVFQISVGAFVLAGIAIFYLWIAWVFQKEVFVYIGEIALAGMFMFLRIVVPEWFEMALFSQFWPVLVVGLSFVTVGLSYALQRLKLSLYVRPSYYTAIILPLIPFIGAWFVGTEISIQTLFGMSVFYFVVSYIRHERRYGYIAIAVFNIALQVLFIWRGIRFGVHPQVFIAPIGITLIGIAHLNRSQMDKKALRLLRPFASAIIYASSTAELYTFGGWASPIILAGLCVLGILAGIALRIRPFLYLGTGFLLVDIFVQIYRAGRGNTWIWWISGVVFGLIILVLFAWFEKRRERVLTLLRTLGEWD